VEDHHSEPAGIIFYITRDSQRGNSEYWRQMHDFRQSSRKSAAPQARIVVKPPTRQLPFIRRGVVELGYLDPVLSQSSDQLSTTKSIASATRANKGKTAVVARSDITEETIRGMLEKYGIEAKPSLSGFVSVAIVLDFHVSFLHSKGESSSLPNMKTEDTTFSLSTVYLKT